MPKPPTKPSLQAIVAPIPSPRKCDREDVVAVSVAATFTFLILHF
jgi:hypothetical protein